MSAQTAGTLTFAFTPIAKTPSYSGTKNALAVWIQTSAGGFVKTKLRYAGSGGGTEDHLPLYAVNSGGSANNCLAAACNKTDATTGATLANFSAKSITWDGKNVVGTVNGTTVADGVYKVTIQETWNHGTTGTNTRSFTFTKGPNQDNQTPAADAYYTGISLHWVPTPLANESFSDKPEVVIYPNPTNGIFNMDFKNAVSNIKVINLLGQEVYTEKIDLTIESTKSVDLSSFVNGIYIVNVSNDKGATSNYKVVLNK